jgi:hypothetical protein
MTARVWATVHPADAGIKGKRRLWAVGFEGIAATIRKLGGECSTRVVREAVARGALDMLDPLSVAGFIAKRLGDHETAARLRGLGRR